MYLKKTKKLNGWYFFWRAELHLKDCKKTLSIQAIKSITIEHMCFFTKCISTSVSLHSLTQRRIQLEEQLCFFFTSLVSFYTHWKYKKKLDFKNFPIFSAGLKKDQSHEMGLNIFIKVHCSSSETFRISKRL